MAKVSTFPEVNHVWKGWEGDKERPHVEDLPAHILHSTGDTISCWKLSWRERLIAIFTGRVWLYVLGHQPPVYITSHRPTFEKFP